MKDSWEIPVTSAPFSPPRPAPRPLSLNHGAAHTSAVVVGGTAVGRSIDVKSSLFIHFCSSGALSMIA